MTDRSELDLFPLYFEKSGPRLTSLKKLLRRAGRLLSRKQVDEILPVFRDGGRLVGTGDSGEKRWRSVCCGLHRRAVGYRRNRCRTGDAGDDR